ncbi:MAG: thiamine-phosphate kinase [Thermoplasmata archaeon HGW-Thermoplasmata-1]|nr:MAG: thiamine-phosphate kinase [Thermoplasmata archaeon HGW-Thermoplasmata-1]
MKLEDIGERAAIRAIVEKLGDASAHYTGDDCAAIPCGDSYILVTTDMITRKTHIAPEMTPRQVGWFSVAISLSDIAAKGGRPMGVVLAFGAPRDTELRYIEDMAAGAADCAASYGTAIIGGDMKENPELTVCGTAIGIVKKEHFMPRAGASEDNLLCVTGELGKAGAGHYAVSSGLKFLRELSKALFEPAPRVKEGMALAESGAVTSCMDLSDGLANSLHQLVEPNANGKVGFEVEERLVPVSKEAVIVEDRGKKTGLDYALYSGGDYELLFTVKKERLEKARGALKSCGCELTVIGKVTGDGAVSLLRDGKRTAMPNEGYEHFRSGAA